MCIWINLIYCFITINRVIESKNQDYPVGTYMAFQGGWQDKNVVKKCNLDNVAVDGVYKLPDFGDLPKSLGLGLFGMPG